MGRQQRPWDTCRGHRRGRGQRHRGRGHRTRRPPVGRPRVPAGRLLADQLDRLRHRLGDRPARPERPRKAAHRGRQHEPARRGGRRSELRLHGSGPRASRDLRIGRAGHHVRRRGRERLDLVQRMATGFLRRGHHGLGHRRLRRRQRQPVIGDLHELRAARRRRHLRRLLEPRLRCRHHRARRVRPIDVPRQHLRHDLGHLDGVAGRDRRGRRVQVAPPGRDARARSGSACAPPPPSTGGRRPIPTASRIRSST